MKKIIIGITGSFASGKSTVAGLFVRLGAKVIDADKIAHSLLRANNSLKKQISGVFGRSILKNDSSIDRNKLGEIVFSDRDALRKLNQIMHPEIIRLIKQKIKSCHNRVIILDAPLLIESGLKLLVDKLVVVKIKRAEQIKRAKKRTLLEESQIVKRIKQQLSLQKKLRLADFIIDNNGQIKKTREQVLKIWNKIQEQKRRT